MKILRFHELSASPSIVEAASLFSHFDSSALSLLKLFLLPLRRQDEDDDDDDSAEVVKVGTVIEWKALLLLLLLLVDEDSAPDTA